jgi:hypothetical protein
MRDLALKPVMNENAVVLRRDGPQRPVKRFDAAEDIVVRVARWRDISAGRGVENDQPQDEYFMHGKSFRYQKITARISRTTACAASLFSLSVP